MIEDEELGVEEEDEAIISSTTTTLLSEEEYQEFLSEGKSDTCDAGDGGDGDGDEGVTSASSDAPIAKEKDGADDGGGSAAAEEKKSETEDKEEQKIQVDSGEVAPKEEEMEDRDKKKAEGGEEQTDGKTASEVTRSDENGKTAADTSQDQPKENGEQEKVATDESVDHGAEQKPGTSGEAKQSEEGKDPEDGIIASSSGRPPPAGSALERRMTAYGRSRAASVSQQRRLSGMSSAHPSDPTGPGHVWDHVMLNCPQFVQLIELFLGPDPVDPTVDALSSFIRNNYTETVQV